MKEIENLTDDLMFLQGVGQKTAQRYAYELLELSEEKRNELINSINGLNNINNCVVCNNYTKDDVCEICISSSREKKKLLIVVTAKDILKIEKVIPDQNYYYVLGQLIDPLDAGSNEFSTKKIEEIIRKRCVEEIVFVLPTSQEGELTAEYIKRSLNNFNIVFSKIAQGVPIGGDLEYLDELTLLRSIQKRQEY